VGRAWGALPLVSSQRTRTVGGVRTRSLQRFVAVGAAVLALTGCVDGPTSMEPAAPSSTASSVTTTATVPSTTTTTEDPAAAVLAAYEGFNRALEAAMDTFDSESSELAEFAGGQFLSRLQAEFRERAELGHRGFGSVLVGESPYVSFASPDTATVRACLLDLMSRVDADGRVIVAPDQAATEVVTVLGLDRGKWKVVGEGPGESGTCELSQ
jgi:hypothetical protein